MKDRLPKLVRNLCLHCEGYIVGGGCDYILEKTDYIKDYDVVIPFHKWELACGYRDETTKLNSFGGFKQISDGIEVDYWMGDIIKLLGNPYKDNIMYAINPLKNIVIKSEKKFVDIY